MNNAQGFSLTEVLISLFLAVSASLGLLSQQWQISRMLNTVLLRTEALVLLENIAERTQAHFTAEKVPPPFSFKPVIASGKMDLVFSWPVQSMQRRSSMHQELVLFQ